MCGGRGGGWRDLPKPNEALIAKLLREDRIDIAVDLAGYTGSSVLWALRQRVVPVQATYLGYPHSTAMPSIDYAWWIPRPTRRARRGRWRRNGYYGWTRHFVLPGAGRCAGGFGATERGGGRGRGRADLPSGRSTSGEGERGDAADLGKGAGGGARVETAPQGRDLRVGRGARAVCRDAAGVGGSTRHGWNSSARRATAMPTWHSTRGSISGWTRFPITAPRPAAKRCSWGCRWWRSRARGHCARVGGFTPESVGLGELIACDEAEYVRIAARLAADRTKLAELRAAMRGRLAASPLCDAERFVRRWEAALRQMWRIGAARAPGLKDPETHGLKARATSCTAANAQERS